MIDSGITRIPVGEEEVIGKVLSSDVVDPETGEILIRCNEELTAEGIAAPQGKEDRLVPIHPYR